MKELKRFDFHEDPRRFKWYLRPIADLICRPSIKRYKPQIHFNGGIENVKGPFLLLCNHNAFQDFSVAYTLLKKKFANFVVAIDGFIGREGLLRNVGCICKRKFTNDLILVKKIKKVLDRGDVPVIYPEARYSLCGTTAVLPASLGKMIKLFKAQVATLVCHGHHVNSPFWDTSHLRGIDHTEAEYSLLLSEKDVNELSVDQINDKIVTAFQYDDFKWQKDNKLEIADTNRADGLDKVLYQCPNCKTEYEMSSSGSTLSCKACGKSWEMTLYGELKARDGKTEFSHIPDWYEWERSNVRQEVRNGTYSTGVMPVTVESLPNAKKFIPLGKGEMIHDGTGFHVKVFDDSKTDTTEINLGVLDTYSVHIEYRYLFKHGDCVDLNTNKDTWYIYPENCKFAVTKMALATEELYFFEREKIGKPCKKGLA